MNIDVTIHQRYDKRSSIDYDEDDIDWCCDQMEVHFGRFGGIVRLANDETERTPLGTVVTSVHYALSSDRLHEGISHCPWCGDALEWALVDIVEPETPECYYCTSDAIEKVTHILEEGERRASPSVVEITTRPIAGAPAGPQRKVETRFACEEHLDARERA